MKYLLRGIDDLLSENQNQMVDVLNPDKNNILCVGTGFEDICNYKCIYCYAGDIPKKDSTRMMKLEHYLSLFQQAHEMGCKTIIITGARSQAEPLLSKKLIPSVKKLKELNIVPVIFTNLSIIGDDELCKKVHGITGVELAETLYDCNVSLILSMDAIDEVIYNKIVDKENAFCSYKRAEERVEQVGFFKPYKIDHENCYTRVCISAVVMKSNYDNLEKIKEYWHSKNCQFICKFPSIMGNVLTNQEQFFTSQEAEERKRKIEELRDKSQTLSVESDGNKFCLMNQLGIALDSRGIPLTCLSGSIAFPDDEEITFINKPLKELISMKKHKYSLKAGACPKKVMFYSKMALN